MGSNGSSRLSCSADGVVLHVRLLDRFELDCLRGGIFGGRGRRGTGSEGEDGERAQGREPTRPGPGHRGAAVEPGAPWRLAAAVAACVVPARRRSSAAVARTAATASATAASPGAPSATTARVTPACTAVAASTTGSPVVVPAQHAELEPAVPGHVGAGEHEQRAADPGDVGPGPPHPGDHPGARRCRCERQDTDDGAHAGGVREVGGDDGDGTARADGAGRHSEERRRSAGQGREREGGSVADLRAPAGPRRASSAGEQREGQGPAREQPGAGRQECDADDHGHDRQVALQRHGERGRHHAEQPEHRHEPDRHPGREPAGTADRGELPCPAGRLVRGGDEQRQVGRQQGEAARVERCDRAGDERQRQQCGAHARLTRRRARRSSCSAPPRPGRRRRSRPSRPVRRRRTTAGSRRGTATTGCRPRR